MKPLNADFAPMSAWRRWWPASWLVLSLAAASFESAQAWRAHLRLASARNAAGASQERGRLERAAAVAESASSSVTAPAMPAEQLRRRIEIDRMRAFDVQAVLSSIDGARIAGVRATAIDVDPRMQSAWIEIEAPSLNEVLAYLDALNVASPRCRWVLDRASKGNDRQSARLHCAENR